MPPLMTRFQSQFSMAVARRRSRTPVHRFSPIQYSTFIYIQTFTLLISSKSCTVHMLDINRNRFGQYLQTVIIFPFPFLQFYSARRRCSRTTNPRAIRKSGPRPTGAFPQRHQLPLQVAIRLPHYSRPTILQIIFHACCGYPNLTSSFVLAQPDREILQ